MGSLVVQRRQESWRGLAGRSLSLSGQAMKMVLYWATLQLLRGRKASAMAFCLAFHWLTGLSSPLWRLITALFNLKSSCQIDLKSN